jgi:hypothetical protein
MRLVALSETLTSSEQYEFQFPDAGFENHFRNRGSIQGMFFSEYYKFKKRLDIHVKA